MKTLKEVMELFNSNQKFQKNAYVKSFMTEYLAAINDENSLFKKAREDKFSEKHLNALIECYCKKLNDCNIKGHSPRYKGVNDFYIDRAKSISVLLVFLRIFIGKPLSIKAEDAEENIPSIIQELIQDYFTISPEENEADDLLSAFKSIGYIRSLDNKVLELFQNKLDKLNIPYKKAFYNDLLGSGYEYLFEGDYSRKELDSKRVEFDKYLEGLYIESLV